MDLSKTPIDINNIASHLVVDENNVWVTTYGNSIVKIDKTTLSFEPIYGFDYSHDIAFDEEFVWVADSSLEKVFRINKSDLTTTTIDVGRFPRGISVDNKFVWVSTYYDTRFTRIDKENLSTYTINIGENKSVDGPTGTGDMTGYNYDHFFATPEPFDWTYIPINTHTKGKGLPIILVHGNRSEAQDKARWETYENY
jgi:hypothetical protein